MLKDTQALGITCVLSSLVTTPTRPMKLNLRSPKRHLPWSSVLAQLTRRELG